MFVSKGEIGRSSNIRRADVGQALVVVPLRSCHPSHLIDLFVNHCIFTLDLLHSERPIVLMGAHHRVFLIRHGETDDNVAGL